MNLLNLPNELLLEITAYLGVLSLIRLSEINELLYKLCEYTAQTKKWETWDYRPLLGSVQKVQKRTSRPSGLRTQRSAIEKRESTTQQARW